MKEALAGPYLFVWHRKDLRRLVFAANTSRISGLTLKHPFLVNSSFRGEYSMASPGQHFSVGIFTIYSIHTESAGWVVSAIGPCREELSCRDVQFRWFRNWVLLTVLRRDRDRMIIILSSVFLVWDICLIFSNLNTGLDPKILNLLLAMFWFSGHGRSTPHFPEPTCSNFFGTTFYVPHILNLCW